MLGSSPFRDPTAGTVERYRILVCGQYFKHCFGGASFSERKDRRIVERRSDAKALVIRQHVKHPEMAELIDADGPNDAVIVLGNQHRPPIHRHHFGEVLAMHDRLR